MLWDVFGTIYKVFSRASGSHLDCQNQSSIPRVMVWIKFVTNSLLSRMLNQWYALAKLRAEIEGREGRVCWGCKRFRHLACNYRNKRVKKKKKSVSQNKFEVIASRVMQCGVREEIKVRRQETMEEVRCFRCWGIGHLKWKCPNIKVGVTNFI